MSLDIQHVLKYKGYVNQDECTQDIILENDNSKTALKYFSVFKTLENNMIYWHRNAYIKYLRNLS